MADRPEPHVLEAFAAETRRVMAKRVPLGVLFFILVVAIAGLIEFVYYPPRLPPLLASFSAEMVLCAAAVLASRRPGLQTHIIPIAVAGTLGVACCVTAYVVASGASGDALAFALVIFLTGVALLYPWGLRGQVPLVVGTLAAYLVAVALGVRGHLPLPYGIFAVAGGAITSLVGARFLDVLRRSIFHQRVLLERTHDRQMAILNEVTRTVTATLELQQVLRLVCDGVLQTLGLDRLWLFWREAAGGEIRGLEARRDAGSLALHDLGGDPSRWGALLAASAPGPTLIEPGIAETAALEDVSDAPASVLRLPLEFRSELVGIILADAGGAADRQAGLADFLDVAATLGNSAAMAIGNARLYAQLDQHRVELQRLSKKGLVVIEEVMRRISRELHDGTCQALMAVKLDLGVLERKMTADAAGARGLLHGIRAQVLDVMHGVRQMSHLIYPPVLDDFGALAAIESSAAKYRDGAGLQVRVHCSDPGMRFTPAVELLLFRVFQEALTNVLKHAQATRVDVRLALEDGVVRLEVADDGHGFDARAYFRSPPASAGLGLLGMRERVGHLGGSFRLTSRRSAGTRIVVTVPAEPLETAKVATA
ncbi:MAG TPA: GAF domain-containing sensor histidine kinase [Candidatus Binatia bacterium]|nr:GAF domain-containing sensor histidine kinase [Candidatus Binatia bacterium]